MVIISQQQSLSRETVCFLHEVGAEGWRRKRTFTLHKCVVLRPTAGG